MFDKKVSIVLIFLFFISLSVAFAESDENVTADAEILTSDSNQVDIYFDALALNDNGDGSKENPYKVLKESRVVNNSKIHLAQGEYSYFMDSWSYSSLGFNISLSTKSNVSFIGDSLDNTVIHGNKNCIWMPGGSFGLYNLTFIHPSINIIAGSLLVDNVKFKDSQNYYCDNYGTYVGGVIYADKSSNVEIMNSYFINSASDYGGAIYINEGYLKVINTTFTNTTSTLLGGAIYANNTNVNISKSKFKTVKSLSHDGGAIYVDDSVLTILDSNFTNCQAGFGCAICTLNSTTTIDKGYFEDNKNNIVSGAIFAMYGKLNISNSKFLNNSDENTYSMILNDIDVNLVNNTFESDYTEILAYYSSLNLVNNTGLADAIIEINEFSFNRNSTDYPLFKFNLTEFTGELPDYYSLVDDGFVSPVKNQKNGGNCWSFTAMAVIESCILKLTNQTYDLSEDNLKNLMAKYSNWGWDSMTNDGGKVAMTVGYLTSWLGPILDTTDIYSDRNTLSHIYDEIFHIDHVIFLKRDNFTDNDDVKRAILTYGAVGGDLMYYNYYLNDQTNAYYCDYPYTSNHAITIVGWNDTYSRNNFLTPPDDDGAWIVKNSWGTDWGDNGFFYVSYYDKTLSKGNNALLYTILLNNTKHYDKNYQYDMGYTKTMIFITDSFTYKNVFTSTGDEYLTAVSTYFFSDVEWTANIYVNNEFITNKSGKSSAGYHIFDLDSIVPLKKGDNFTVEFIQKTNGANVSFPVSEISDMNRNVLKEGISFYKNGDNWYDMYTNQSGVICIKAFTITGYHAVITLDATLTNITATVRDDDGNNLTEGEVIFSINGEIHKVDINNGVASFDYDLTEDSFYNITVTLNATAYNPVSKFLTIHHNLDMNLTVSDVSYGGEIVLNITLKNETEFSDNVVVFIGDKNYTIFISKQNTLYSVFDKFDVGNYTARLIHKGHFETINKTASFNIIKAVNKITASVENTTYLNNAVVVVKADADGIYQVKVNDTIVNVTVSNGVGSNQLSLPAGKYYAGISWSNSNYDAEITNTTFQVNKADIAMDLNATADGNIIRIHVNASKAINENVTISLDKNNVFYWALNNGELRYNLKEVPYGEHNVSLLFNNTNFNMITKSVKCVVGTYNILMNVSVKNITVGENLDVSVKLSHDSQTNPSGNVTVYIDNINQTLNVTSTTLNFSIPNLAYGNYNLKVVYSGDSLYSSQTKNVAVNVSKITPTIIVSNSVNYNGRVSVTLSEGLSENITIYLNGVQYLLPPAGTSFYITFPNLDAGSYSMNISYPGDDKYLPLNLTTSFTVNKADTSLSLNSISTNVVAAMKGIPYSVTLKDSEGNALAGKSVHAAFNGVTYYSTTAGDGVANFVFYSSSAGSKQVIAGFDGDSNYVGTSSVNTISISKVKTSIKASKKTYKKSAKSKKVSATLKDAYGNAVKGVKVVFKIKNKKYSAKTSAKGLATVKVKLSKKGSYKVKITFSGNGIYFSSGKTITLKIK